MTNEDIPIAAATETSNVFSFILGDDWTISIDLSTIPIIVLVASSLAALAAWQFCVARRVSEFEIDGADIGIGNSRFSFKPNDTDRQIAYSIWVELSTRKIGLPLDLEKDVIVEVYDSWYTFFKTTRELVKTIPVSKVRRDSTGKIVNLAIEVLNDGMRPHLTEWQARYRRWYEHEVHESPHSSPQEIQRRYPDYDALCIDLALTNERLVKYREKMNELATGP